VLLSLDAGIPLLSGGRRKGYSGSEMCYLDSPSRKEAGLALSIKTAEADRLARDLSRLTGETMTRAVTLALRERLEREREKRGSRDGLAERMAEFAARVRPLYDTRPVTKEEWDAASGDDAP
jgi:antitoxin VapB